MDEKGNVKDHNEERYEEAKLLPCFQYHYPFLWYIAPQIHNHLKGALVLEKIPNVQVLQEFLA